MKKGFTLVELLAVVLIVAILMGVGIPQYRKAVAKARVAEAESMLRIIYDSSERLAGEFGYRSYEELMTDKGANLAKYGFGRLDMFDESHLPKGCSIDDQVLKCKRFSYKISQNGYVAAKGNDGSTFKGVYILLKRDNLELYCKSDRSDDPDRANKFCIEVLALDPKPTFSWN